MFALGQEFMDANSIYSRSTASTSHSGRNPHSRHGQERPRIISPIPAKIVHVAKKRDRNYNFAHLVSPPREAEDLTLTPWLAIPTNSCVRRTAAPKPRVITPPQPPRVTKQRPHSEMRPASCRRWLLSTKSFTSALFYWAPRHKRIREAVSYQHSPMSERVNAGVKRRTTGSPIVDHDAEYVKASARAVRARFLAAQPTRDQHQ